MSNRFAKKSIDILYHFEPNVSLRVIKTTFRNYLYFQRYKPNMDLPNLLKLQTSTY